MSIIVYGPQGCGKTKHAEALRAHFNCDAVVDEAEWPKGQRELAKFKAGNDLLLITADEAPGIVTSQPIHRRIFSFEEAAAEAGLDLRVHDEVNHPDHYAATDNGIECIDAIRAALGRDGFIAFLRGQVIKYSWRLGKKGAAVTDAEKAQWYQAKLVEVLHEPT